MVAKIKSGKSLIGALNYNEHKVKLGKARLIATGGYVKSLDRLSFADKLLRLKDRAERNLRTKTNTVHLSLNFDVSENIDQEVLITIADEYMKRIGFEYQPYLIYQHFDAGHPHLHILTTNIGADGKRLSLHHIGALKSEPARKAIELEFGLVRAESKKMAVEQFESPEIKPLEYGKTATKRAIARIVSGVTRSYKFTSLPEFNAILGLYHVTADRGSKDSVMFKMGGLHYWATDENGKKTGVPIKASSLYLKPTLKLLENRFRLNEYLRKPFKEKLKAKIDRIAFPASSMEQFKHDLKKAGLTAIIRQNSEGRIYGISYIDHVSKVIFNGSDLGKNYSAAAIVQALFHQPAGNDPASGEKLSQHPSQSGSYRPPSFTFHRMHGLLEELLNPPDPVTAVPNQFGPRKRKKKRKTQNL